MTFWLAACVVFVAMIACDYCWARYTHWVAQKAPLKAASWSAMILLSGAICTVSYVENRKLLPFVVAGAFVGTYLAVKKNK